MAAHAAAPAVDKRTPLFGAVAEVRLQHRGDVSCHQRRAYFSGLERGLRVQQADFVTLGVVQNGTIQRAGDMILREFGGGSDVDDFIEIGAFFEGVARDGRRW